MIWAARKGFYLSPVGNPTAFAARYAELERTQALSSIRKETARQVEALERELTWERAVKQERAFLESAASRRRDSVGRTTTATTPSAAERMSRAQRSRHTSRSPRWH